MSALGHKRTFAVQNGMSASPPIADMCGAKRDVRFVPIADISRLACLHTFSLYYCGRSGGGQKGSERLGSLRLFCTRSDSRSENYLMLQFSRHRTHHIQTGRG